MKTYGETFSALLKDAPARDTHGDYFGEAEARERLHFEPGTSTDIGFVTLVGVKFALDLLNLESEAYTPARFERLHAVHAHLQHKPPGDRRRKREDLPVPAVHQPLHSPGG